MPKPWPTRFDRRVVRFYFDFISPYSYLASQRLSRFDSLNDAQPVPVVLGSILSHYDTQGPGEIPARRRAGLTDVLLLADLYGLPLRGPPKHPFNSVPALRLVTALAPEQQLPFVQRAFAAGWGDGEDLSDFTVLDRLLQDLKIQHIRSEDAATDRDRRAQLKADTKSFLQAGGVGVPTFEVKGTFFFGHDRMELATEYAQDQVRFDPETLERMLGRPQPERIR